MKTAEIKVYGQKTATETNVKSLMERQIEWYDTNRFGLMTVFITAQSCLGGIAAMYILQGGASNLLLSICSMVTMGANAMMIAQASAKACLLTVYGAIMVNLVLIALELWS